MSRAFTITLFLLVGLLGACGGDGDDESTTTAPSQTTSRPTKAEYIAAADAICAERNRDAKRLNQRSQRVQEAAANDEETLANLVPVFEQGIPQQRVGIARLARLQAPSGEEEAVQMLIAYERAELAVVERLHDAAKSGDVNRFQTLLQERERARERSQAYERRFGFKECGSGKEVAG